MALPISEEIVLNGDAALVCGIGNNARTLVVKSDVLFRTSSKLRRKLMNGMQERGSRYDYELEFPDEEARVMKLFLSGEILHSKIEPDFVPAPEAIMDVAGLARKYSAEADVCSTVTSWIQGQLAKDDTLIRLRAVLGSSSTERSLAASTAYLLAAAYHLNLEALFGEIGTRFFLNIKTVLPQSTFFDVPWRVNKIIDSLHLARNAPRTKIMLFVQTQLNDEMVGAHCRSRSSAGTCSPGALHCSHHYWRHNTMKEAFERSKLCPQVETQKSSIGEILDAMKDFEFTWQGHEACSGNCNHFQEASAQELCASVRQYGRTFEMKLPVTCLACVKSGNFHVGEGRECNHVTSSPSQSSTTTLGRSSWSRVWDAEALQETEEMNDLRLP